MKVVITHKVRDVDVWKSAKSDAEREAFFAGVATNVVSHRSLNFEDTVALTMDVKDVMALAQLLASLEATDAAEKRG